MQKYRNLGFGELVSLVKLYHVKIVLSHGKKILNFPQL